MPPAARAELRIDDAVEVERGRRHRGLAQHYVDLPAVMSLVVKEVADGHGRRVPAFLFSTVDVNQFPFKKT